MFYSQFILAKKGPLGTIWIAAHLERKLRKNQVADTDIGVSVDSILFPEVPIALRLSSHLLLGVVRIYNRKVNYLFDDCSEALLKVKQAFRSTAVDLPPEESKAPYHSITLPETFDLDDFELPDSDIFQGNYVDHHISSREQITLQDTMEGVSYSTSKFGLDERFGDGDASGLDLDEELFMDKIGTSGHAEEGADPQTSFRPMSPVKQEEHPEDRPSTSENMVDGDECADLMDYAQAPRTPGLAEEPNLSNVQDASTCDDHLEAEYNLTQSTVKETTNNIPYEEDKQDVDWCSRDDKLFDELPHEENGYLEMKESKPEEESPNEANPESVSLKESSLVVSEDNNHLSGQDEALKPASEFTHKEDKTDFVSVDEAHDNHQGPDEVPGSVEDTSNQHKSCHDGSELALENQVGSSLETPEIQACQETTESRALNIDAHGAEAANETPFLRPCNSNLEQPDADLQCDSAALATAGSEEATNLGEVHGKIGDSEQNLKENQVQEHEAVEDIHITASEQNLKENQAQEHAGVEDIHITANEQNLKENHLQGHAAFEDTHIDASEKNQIKNQVQEHAAVEDIHIPVSSEADGQVDNTTSHDKLVENINNSTEVELPAPEKLLTVPESHLDLHGDMLVEVSPGNFDEGDAGSKTAAGRKRSFTESTLTEQSLNSVESSRQVRIKRTAASVPDDDDLLSSILVGRRSSVLKVKPTPPLSEVTSVKRTRGGPRSSAPKRKVLMDDTMVLHGDAIRQQLTSTEDIRRVRKKAPCTLPEISMIQKQHLEDEIFLETIFTGTSAELASLHGQVYDLSRIRICQVDVNDASLETMAEIRLPSQNDEIGVSLETEMEAYLASHDNKYDVPHGTVAELHLTSPSNENLDREDEKEPDKTNVIEESGPQVNDELLIMRDNEIAEASENVGPNDSQKELLFDPDIASASAGVVEAASLNETNEMDSRVDLDASFVVAYEKTDMPSVELDSANVDDEKMILPSVELDSANVDDEQAIARDEVAEKDGDVNQEDDVLPGGAQQADVEVGTDANHEDLENNVQSETHNITYEEQREMEFSYPVLEDGFMNNGENPDLLEAYQSSVMMDAEISGLDPHGRDEVDYLAAGNDTEFLNVDDDDLTEMADDYAPDADEAQYTENSGWSSRTRAVSKYLQAAFVKEAESGRKSLSMENLLIGKSRKEASRMFFETLVLKTRDYIHVEQRNPFDDVAIKPRTRLMKSNF